MDIDPALQSTTENLNISTHDANNDRPESASTSVVSPQTSTQISSAAYERWSKLPKPRGRQPRDPHGQSIKFSCRDIDDLEHSLHDYLEAPTLSAEHVTLEFSFPVSSAFMVYASDIKNTKKTSVDNDKQQHTYGKNDRTAISILDALAPTEDSKDQMRRQKAIAKVCVETCEKADGFRYSFHNNWLSREDEACRFSYFCNDSTLNKGRAANEGAGMVGKKMRKPVYDCQGLVAVKFSLVKQNLEVHYKHIPLHKTYAERAPPPRRDSKRRRIMEISEPEHSLIARMAKDRVPTNNSSTSKSQRKPIVEYVTTREDIEPISIAETRNPQFLIGAPGPGQNSLNNEIAEKTPQPVSGSASPSHRSLPGKPRRPPIPGTMAGSVQNGHLNWGGKPAPTQPSRTSKKASSKTTRALQVVNSSPSRSDTPNSGNIALQELEALKKKLEEAEERIRKLESEKSAVPPPLPPSPLQHPQWPPPGFPHPLPAPSGYYHSPHPPYPYYPQPPIPPPPGQTHFQPPQQPPSSTANEQSNTTSDMPNLISSPAPQTTSPAPKKQASARSAATKFVLYTPSAKPKQYAERTQTASPAIRTGSRVSTPTVEAGETGGGP